MIDILHGPTPSRSPLAVPFPQLLPSLSRPLRVDMHVLDDDPVDVPRLPESDVAVFHVRNDQVRVPFQREAPTAPAAAAKAHLVALHELQSPHLPSDHRLPALPENDTGVRR